MACKLVHGRRAVRGGIPHHPPNSIPRTPSPELRDPNLQPSPRPTDYGHPKNPQTRLTPGLSQFSLPPAVPLIRHPPIGPSAIQGHPRASPAFPPASRSTALQSITSCKLSQDRQSPLSPSPAARQASETPSEPAAQATGDPENDVARTDPVWYELAVEAIRARPFVREVWQAKTRFKRRNTSIRRFREPNSPSVSTRQI